VSVGIKQLVVVDYSSLLFISAKVVVAVVEGIPPWVVVLVGALWRQLS